MWQINLVGAICYGVGAILADKYKARFISIIVMAPLGVIGYAIVLSPQKFRSTREESRRKTA
jgi:hypothetical protein